MVECFALVMVHVFMWFDIPNFPMYKISKEGKIYSLYSNGEISTYINENGYECIKLQDSGKQKTKVLSRLLALVFLGLDESSEDEVDHIDGNIENNRLDNLQVLSREKHKQKTAESQGKTYWGQVFAQIVEYPSIPVNSKDVANVIYQRLGLMI